MRTVCLCLVLLIVPSILALHWWGKQVNDAGQSPADLGIGREDDSKTDVRSSESPPVKPPRPDPPVVTPEVKPILPPVGETFSAFTEVGARRKIRLFPVKCVGGPVDGRTHLLPASPSEMVRCGYNSVWVPGFTEYLPAPDRPPPKKDAPPAPAYYFVTITPPDPRRMEIASMSLYVIEEVAEGYQLAFSGQADLDEYARIEKAPASPHDKTEKERLPAVAVSLRVPRDAVRRQKVFPMRLAGGPAGGRVTLLPVEAESLFKCGMDYVAVVEVSLRPPDRSNVASIDRAKPFDHIGHMSIYALEQQDGGSVRGQYLHSVAPDEYLTRHMASILKAEKE